MVAGTLLAVVALLSQVDSLALLWDTVENVTWWWVALAVVFAFANKVGYAIALMGSVATRLRFGRSVEALLAAAFSNLALPGVGSTAVQVRYLQRQGVQLASAVAGGAVLANIANVVVQGTLFLVALLATSQTLDTDKIDLDNVGWILTVVVLLAGVVVALIAGVQRIRRHVLPPTKPPWPRSELRSTLPTKSCCSSVAISSRPSCQRCACWPASAGTAAASTIGRSSL